MSKEIHDYVSERIGKAVLNKPVMDFFEFGLNYKYQMLMKKMPQLKKLSESYRRIKEYSINNLEELVKIAKENLEKNNNHVFIAKTAEDAKKYVLKETEGVDLITKSKSTTAKECGITKALEERGVTIIETDLGDRIIQIGKEEPSLPIGPAVHVTLGRVAEIFSKDLGYEVEPDFEPIRIAARKNMREKMLQGKTCLTGANAIGAEDGIIGLIENEGNISLITRLADKHIAVAGIDKIVPDWESATTIIKSMESFLDICGSYTSFIKGPSRTADLQGINVLGMHGAQEVHVVLVDDWRTRAKNSGFEELLYCTNCSACFFACTAVLAGGLAYGSEDVKGGIGVVRSAFTDGIEDAVKNGLFMCIGCKACTELCPGRIDIASMIERLRAIAIEQGFGVPSHIKIAEYMDKYENPFGESLEKKTEWMKANK
ncbi:MAG: LUD domain-containing protein [Candidatus Jordarchaeum sp.]|uniref:LUD domain-containing protein n=1 Tax=Candidatus Jordarchaeum sp. TaxID=2823881 RepID=UPI00404A1DDE